MTTLLALALVLLALGVTLYPLRRSPAARLPARMGRVRELEERYRSALADLRDIDLDRDIGNLAEPEYEALRARYRHQAAATLSEIAIEREVRARLAAADGLVTRNRVAKHVAQPRVTRTLAGALVPAAVLSLAVVIGIVALYVSQASRQAAQEPLAVLPMGHAHTAVVEPDGEYWVGHHDGLLRSVDGREWRPGAPAGDVMAIVDLPSGGGRLLLGHDVLVASKDDGASWTPLPHDLPGTDVHGAQAAGGHVYAYVMGFGLFRTRDGLLWEPLGSGLAGNVSSLAALQGPTLFVAADGRAFRSPDSGRTWTDSAGAGNLALTGVVRAIAAEPSRPVLYAGTSDGLFQSNPTGTQWTRLPFREPVAAVGVREQTVAVVDDRGRFFLSRDGGVTWAGS